MSQFDLRVTWLPAPDGTTAFGPERTTWAQLEIRLLGELLTSNHPADRTSHDQPFVVGGMSGLCDWIVEHWLAIRWESHTPFAKVRPIQGGGGQARFPSRRDAQGGWVDFVADDDSITGSALGAWQQRHTVGEAATDLALPSIVLIPEGNCMGVGLDHLPAALSPTVRFTAPVAKDAWPAPPVWVSLADVVDALGSFVEATIDHAARSEESKNWAQWLRGAWQDVRSQSDDPTVQRRLQYGPVVARHWDDLQRRLGHTTASLEEILKDSTVVTDEAVIDWLARELTRGGPAAAVNNAASVREPPPFHVDWSMPLWREGYRLAQALRRHLRLADRPLQGPVLDDVLNAMHITARGVDAKGLFRGAIWPSTTGDAMLWATDDPRHASQEAQRFTIAATIGRALAADQLTGKGSAAHGVQSRWRPTQLANAFAAELLLPIQAIRTAGGNVDRLRTQYGISKSAAEWHVANRIGSADA